MLRVSQKKDGLVLGLQKNLRTRSREVELPKHQSGSSEVSSHGHYRSQESMHDVDDQTVEAILQLKRRLAAVEKHNGGPIQHIFC